jgi:hypothetical protein
MMVKNLQRFLPHPIVSFVFFLFILIYWQQSNIFLRHHDIGWHIAAGQQIRELGYIPKYDSWSFTSGDFPWLNISWLWDIGVSKIYDVFGFALLVQATTILGAVVCALLARICLSLGISSLLTLFGVLLVGLIFPFYQPPWDYVLSVAPQSVSLLFFLVFYLLLIKRDKRLYLLPLLMILWVNLHGGFLLGLILLAVAFLSSGFSAAKNIFVVSVLCALVIFINPLGVDIITAVLRGLTGVGNATITEWMPFELGLNLATAYLILLLFCTIIGRAKIPKFCLLVALIFIVLGLMQKRNFVFLLFSTLPLLLMNLQVLMVGKFASFEQDMASRKVTILSALFAAIVFAYVATPFAVQKRYPDGVLLPAEFYPVSEIEYLRGRIADGESEMIFNHWNLGGYLIFSLRDKVKVFIDGRADTVYPPSVIKMQGGHLAMLEANKDIKFAIMPSYQPLSQAYFENSGEWKAVFVGKVAKVYERN